MQQSRRDILWVDDEIEFLRAHIMFLESRGYRVTPVYNGDDAIHFITEDPDKFDMVLLDEKMPGKDGLQTLEEIKAIKNDLPVVMVTKSEEEKLMEDAIGRKIDGFLTKPVNPSQILLVCKKTLYSKEIISNSFKQKFIRNYSQNKETLQNQLTYKEWVRLYAKLAYWDIELQSIRNEEIRQAHTGQKSDANSAFADYIINNYVEWVEGTKEGPLFTPGVIEKIVKPEIDKSGRVYIVLMDSLRMDQYLLVEELIKEYYNVKRLTYCSILPTTSFITRSSFLSGKFPLSIKEAYSDKWPGLCSSSSRDNIFEEQLLKDHVRELGMEEKDADYIRISDSSEAEDVKMRLGSLKDKKLIVMDVDFVDMLIKSRSESKVIQEISYNENILRKITSSWFESSHIYELLAKISEEDSTVVLTTCNGSKLCTQNIDLYGDERENFNFRFRLGKEISVDERYGLVTKEPWRFKVPAGEGETMVLARENYQFAKHHVFESYNENYANTIQSGGISMEEMILPFAVLKPKR